MSFSPALPSAAAASCRPNGSAQLSAASAACQVCGRNNIVRGRMHACNQAGCTAAGRDEQSPPPPPPRAEHADSCACLGQSSDLLCIQISEAAHHAIGMHSCPSLNDRCMQSIYVYSYVVLDLASDIISLYLAPPRDKTVTLTQETPVILNLIDHIARLLGLWHDGFNYCALLLLGTRWHG